MNNKVTAYMEKIKRILEKILFNSVSSFFIITILLLSYCYIKPIAPFDKQIVEISEIIAIVIMVLYLMRLRASNFVISIAIYISFLFFSTIIGENSSINQLYKTYYKIIAIVFYIDWGLNVNKKRMINSLFYSLFAIITINFITILIYPNGIYTTLYENNKKYTQNWFLKYKNIHIMMYMPALLLDYIRYKYKNKIDLISILLLFMITFSVYYCDSANSIVAYSIFLIYLFMRKMFDKIKIMNIITYFVIFLLILIFIVVFRWQEKFSWFIVDILGKDLTFTHRTEIWDKIIFFIQQNPIFGYGVETIKIIAVKLGDSRFAHAHNTILDILYKGGILSFIPYITMIALTVVELFKNRSKEIAKFASFILFCIFIMMNFEARQEVIGLYLVLLPCYYIEEIIEDINNKGYNKKEISNS